MVQDRPIARFARWAATTPGMAAIVAVFILASTLGVSAFRAPPPSTTVGNSGVTTEGNWVCNPPNSNSALNRSPAALNVPLNGPTKTEPAGSFLNVSFEFRLVNFTKADRSITIYIPETKAVLAVNGGSPVELSFAPKNLTESANGWSKASIFSASKTLTSNTSFASGTKAYLTTSKIAVMAKASSGSITIEFRWQWTVHNSTSRKTTSSPWSVPTRNESYPWEASIFFPAPWVGVLWTSSSPAPSGSTFYLLLDGAVSNTSFRMVLEYPSNGTEIQSNWEYTALGATTFNSTVPLNATAGGGVAPGNYLIHVHDQCQAIVHLQSITVT